MHCVQSMYNLRVVYAKNRRERLKTTEIVVSIVCRPQQRTFVFFKRFDIIFRWLTENYFENVTIVRARVQSSTYITTID